MKDLGWMNGWTAGGSEYKVIEKCRELKHVVARTHDGRRCVSSYTCEECGICYKVDSSG
jgi:hypothetical protein